MVCIPPSFTRRLVLVATHLIGPSALEKHSFEKVRFTERAGFAFTRFAPGVRWVLRFFLWFMEYEPLLRHGSRLSRLAPEKQAAFFARHYAHPNAFWRMSILRLVQSLIVTVYYSDAVVAASVGYPEKESSQDHASGGSPHPRRRDFPTLAPPENGETITTDYLVIGTGAGGAVVAAGLAEAGKEVLIIEEGGLKTTKDFQNNSYDRYLSMYRDGGMIASLGFPPVVIPVGKTVGGTTTINSGTCFRLPDDVLATWRDEFGLAELTPEILEPFFSHIEAVLKIGPVTPETQGPNFSVIDRGVRALGLAGGPLIRNAPGCVNSAECCFGCPSGAKQSMEQNFMPRALRAGAKVMLQTRAEKILQSAHRVDGIAASLVDENGAVMKRFAIKAKKVIVSCGSLLTPVLLKRSHIRSSRALGRHLSVHPTAKVVGFFDEPLDGFRGVPQGYQTGFMHEKGLMYETIYYPPWLMAVNYAGIGDDHGAFMERYRHYGLFGFLISDKPNGRIFAMPDGRPLILYNFGAREHALYIEGLQWLCRILLAAGARRVYTGAHSLPVITSLDQINSLTPRNLPRRHLESAAFHPLGTCRMGRYPHDSVVDSNLRVHDYDNLFIADGSIFPSSLGVNPQLTIMAFAARLAAAL